MIKKIFISAVTISVFFVGNALAYKDKSSTSCVKQFQNNLIPKVVTAVSKTGLSATQTKKVADAIVSYKATMLKIEGMEIFPIDSFIDDNFNENNFIKEMSEKYMAKIVAKAALFKYIFTILNKEQRKSFKNAYAAPVIEKMIKLNY